jgi:hypothetical protein
VAHLVVDAPPVITSQPVGATVTEGGVVTLNVTAVGTPPVKYQWTLNGRNLAGATNLLLVLADIHSSQAGEYAVKITTPAGTIVSSNALVTVLTETILIYNYSGQETCVDGSQTTAYDYAGELIYLPGSTNGTFVAWGKINGKKEYWVGDFANLTLYTAGSGAQSWTVLGQACQGTDSLGHPSFWSTVYQGQNSQLPVGTRKSFTFPGNFTGAQTDVYPDLSTGNLILYQFTAGYTFAPQATQSANNTGATPADLENAQIQSLTKQGYIRQN